MVPCTLAQTLMIDHDLLRPLIACAALSATFLAPDTFAQRPLAPVPAPAPRHYESGNLVFDGIPPPDPALAARLARYQQSRGATFFDWLAGRRPPIGARLRGTDPGARVCAA